MAAERHNGPNDLEGAGPGGGADVVQERRAEPRPGSRIGLMITVVLVALVLLVPVLWAAGVYAGLVVLPGVGPAATAGYLLLAILIATGAVLYFWAQFSRSV